MQYSSKFRVGDEVLVECGDTVVGAVDSVVFNSENPTYVVRWFQRGGTLQTGQFPEWCLSLAPKLDTQRPPLHADNDESGGEVGS